MSHGGSGVGLDEEFVRGLILRLPVVLFALTVHEFMHGWVAHKCGDDTALDAGRLTLNPLPHLDFLGTLCLMFAPIGWAKPVPVNPANFAYETRRRDEILVSGAGVAANFAMGVGFALLIRFLAPTLATGGDVAAIVFQILFFGALINFGLAIFNLLPIPPLDGSHILENLLPLNAAIRFREFRRYGIFLLVGFVLLSRSVGRATGVSILGYPIFKLIHFFSGFEF